MATIPHFVRLDFAYASQTVFYVMAGIMAAAGVVAMIGLRRGRQQEPPEPDEDEIGPTSGQEREQAPARWLTGPVPVVAASPFAGPGNNSVPNSLRTDIESSATCRWK